MVGEEGEVSESIEVQLEKLIILLEELGTRQHRDSYEEGYQDAQCECAGQLRTILDSVKHVVYESEVPIGPGQGRLCHVCGFSPALEYMDICRDCLNVQQGKA